MITDGLEWCGLLWCFYQTLILTAPIHCRASIDSHSDGTHSLQSIHCWDTVSKSDEETNSSWSWTPESEHIFSKFSFLGRLFKTEIIWLKVYRLMIIRNVSSKKSAHYNDFWRSYDTEDWSNDAENTALFTEVNYCLTHIHIENNCFKL